MAGRPRPELPRQRPAPAAPPIPPRPRPSGLTMLAAVIVGLALLAVGFVVWQQSANPGAAGTSAATARVTTTVRASSTARTSTAARPSYDPVSGLPWVDESTLPAQAKRVLAQIDKGGPYDYDKDGTTFRNAEGLLPKAATGFYKEYTVVLPGSNDRGPVRIIVGGRGEFFYWTTDHYASFSRIRR